MKKLFATLLTAGFVACMSSCGTSKKAEASDQGISGKWTISAVEGYTINKAEIENEAFMNFNTNENKVNGCAGCNTFFGELKVNAKKHTIEFGHAGSTRMLCANMKVEDKVMKALNKVAKYELKKDGSLVLKSADGNDVITLVK